MFFIPYGTREHEPKRRFPFITWLLVLINVVVFLAEAYAIGTGGEPALASFIDKFAVQPSNITDGTPLATGLLTSMFLHAGLLHIAGNMVYFLPFGDNVEDRLGHVRYLIFYLLCGLIATLTFVFFNPNSNVPLLGASGAVAGVLAGYLALHPRGVVKGFLFIVILLTRVDLPAFVFIGYWFVMQLFSSIASFSGADTETGGVAFIAHVGGFIAGLILAPLMALTVRGSDRRHAFAD